MKRFALCCVASGFMGGLLALYLQDANSASRLGAQEPSRGQIPGLATAVGGAWSGVGQPVGPQELTPEERVNIAVYENVNRSVVNINTKARTEAFFFLEIPTEGMGSGSVLDKSGHILTNFHVVEAPRRSKSRCLTAARTRPNWWGRIPAATWPC